MYNHSHLSLQKIVTCVVSIIILHISLKEKFYHLIRKKFIDYVLTTSDIRRRIMERGESNVFVI